MQEEINKWLKENPDIEVTNVSINHLVEFFIHCPDQIANQWYTTIVTYKVPTSSQKSDIGCSKCVSLGERLYKCSDCDLEEGGE